MEKQLQILPKEEREDILKELESQLFESSQHGEHPEAILERLGKASDYARPFLNDYLEEIQSHGSFNDHLHVIWKKALWPGLILLMSWIALMLGNTAYIFSDLTFKAQANFWQITKLLFTSLPAILVISVPFVVLWVVPLYLFSLRGQEPRQVFKHPKVYLVTLSIGLASTVFAYAIQDLIVPASNRYTVEILKDMMQTKQKIECKEDCAEQPKLVFSDQPDVRSLSAHDAKVFLYQIR